MENDTPGISREGSTNQTQSDLDRQFITAGEEPDENANEAGEPVDYANEVEEESEDSSAEDEGDSAPGKDQSHKIKSIAWLIAKQAYVKRATAAKDGIHLRGKLEDEDEDEEGERERSEEQCKEDGVVGSVGAEVDPRLAKVVDEVWNIQDLEDGKDENEMLAYEPYISLLIKFQYIIMPRPVDRSKIRNNAEIDWIRDTCGGNCDTKMTYKQFVLAILQLVETWSSESDVEKQVEALTALLNGATELVEIRYGEGEEEGPGEMRRCLLPNARIETNDFFATVAKKKFKRARSKKKKAGGKQQVLSRPLTLQYITKLYQQKFDQDKKHLSNGALKLERFDTFIKAQFVMEYGSKKNAKCQLNRFVRSVQKFSEKNVRIRLFAKLAGLDISPKLNDDKAFEQYDPGLCSSHFLPFLDSLTGNRGSFGFILATTENQQKVTITAFKLKLRAHCKNLPTNNRVLSSYVRALESGDYSLLACKERKVAVDESIEGVKFREMKDAQYVSLDTAMLAAYDVWRTDKKWHLVYSQVCTARAATRWHNCTFKERTLSQTVQSISTIPLVKRRIDFCSYQGIVRLSCGKFLY